MRVWSSGYGSVQGWEPSLQCCSSPSPATSGRRTNGTISFVLYSFFHLCFLLHFLLNVFLLYLFPLYYFPVIPFFPYFLSPHSLSSSCFFLLSLPCSFLFFVLPTPCLLPLYAYFCPPNFQLPDSSCCPYFCLPFFNCLPFSRLSFPLLSPVFYYSLCATLFLFLCFPTVLILSLVSLLGWSTSTRGW